MQDLGTSYAAQALSQQLSLGCLIISALIWSDCVWTKMSKVMRPLVPGEIWMIKTIQMTQISQMRIQHAVS